MHERIDALVAYPVPSGLLTVLSRRMRGAKDWDEDFFQEAWSELAREYVGASVEKQADVLMDRYFDATRPYEGQIQSRFQQRFVAPIPEMSYAPEIERQIKQGSVLVACDPAAESHVLTRRVAIYQYGPSRIYDVPPGSWVEVSHMGEQDVVGTTDLTACSVVVGYGERHCFLAHVLSSQADQVQELFRQLQQNDHIVRMALVAPFWRDEDGRERQDWNQRLQQLAHDAEADLSWFPYVGYATHKPYPIDSTTVLLGQGRLRRVGARFRTVGSPFAERPVRRTTLIGESIQDRSLSFSEKK